MYSSLIYYYIPREKIVMTYGNSTRRYQTVYAKTMKLHKGIDNRLQFQLLNQDQKPIDTTGKTLFFRIISEDGNQLLFSKILTNVFALNGILQLDILYTEIIDIPTQYCFYTLEINDGDLDLPVFTDSNSGARGRLQIVDSILPNFTPSNLVNVPNHQLPTLTGPAVTYYSSIFSSREGYTVTAQLYFDNYTGTVQLQGSTVVDNDWYDVGDMMTYTSQMDCDYMNISGYHPYMRIKFVSTGGDTKQIYTR